MILKRKKLLILSLVLLTSACGGGGGSSPTNNTPSPIGPVTLVPVSDLPDGLIHSPLSIQESAFDFYETFTTPDGRVMGLSVLDTSEKQRFFSTGPDDFNSVTLLTPEPEYENAFAFSQNRSVYIEQDTLYSKGSTSPVVLSATDKVSRFWLSADQSKVLYIANQTTALVFDPATQSSKYVQRSALYSVNVTGGNRVRLSIADTNSNVAFESHDAENSAHNQRPQFLPDMSRIIYIVTPESTGLSELHSVLADGTDDIVLNANIGISSNAGDYRFNFSITPDSSHIVYGLTNANVMELYSITPNGLSNTKISGPLVSGGTVYTARDDYTLAISPDSSFIVYLASAETATTNELYRVSLDGTGLIKMSQGLNVSSQTLKITSDSATLLYYSNGLYKTSTSGGTPERIDNGLDLGRVFIDSKLTTDETRLVYVAYDNTTEKDRLYISKLDGSSTIDLTGPLITQGEVYSGSSNSPYFMLDPVSERVIYRADAITNSDYALFAINLDGTNRIKITPERLHTNSTESRMTGFVGNKFYFSYDKTTANFTELYVYDFSNNTSTNISSNWPKIITEDVARSSLQQSINGAVQSFISETSAYKDAALVIRSPDTGCRVNFPKGTESVNGKNNYLIEPTGNAVYYTLRGITSNWQFYRAFTKNCATTLLNKNISERLNRMRLSPDGLSMAFTGAEGGLYVTNNNGSDAIELNSERTTGGVKGFNTIALNFSHDSNTIIYLADENTQGVFELFSITRDGLTRNRINGELTTNGEVYNSSIFTPVITEDDQWVIYPATQNSSKLELYKSRLDGSDNTQLTNNQLNENISINLGTTPDSTKAVYFVRNSATKVTDMYAVNLNTTPAAPIKLNPAFSSAGAVLTYGNQITPDSKSVVYMSRDDTNAPRELFVTGLNATGHTKLNGTLQENEIVFNLKLSKDGQKVVYIIGNELDGSRTGLYVSNIDGSSNTLLAVPTAVEFNRSNEDYQLTSDNRVVFRATLNGTDGIYIMPLDASVEASLIVEIQGGQNLREMQLVNDQRIMLIGDLRLQGIYEAFNYNL